MKIKYHIDTEDIGWYDHGGNQLNENTELVVRLSGDPGVLKRILDGIAKVIETEAVK